MGSFYGGAVPRHRQLRGLVMLSLPRRWADASPYFPSGLPSRLFAVFIFWMTCCGVSSTTSGAP